MVQKSILSFFSAPKAKKPEEGASGGTTSQKKNGSANSEPEDSPIKKRGRRLKSRVIESDSEDETEQQQPTTSSSPSKSDEEKESPVNDDEGKGRKKGPAVKNSKRKTPIQTGKAKKSDEEKEDDQPSDEDKMDTEEESKGRKKSPAVRSSKRKTPVKNGKAKKENKQEGKKSNEEKEDNQPSEEEKMDTEEESVNEDRENDDGQKMDGDISGELEDEDDSMKKDNVDSPSTPGKKSSPSSSQKSPGFTPSTVPPHRQTAPWPATARKGTCPVENSSGAKRKSSSPGKADGPKSESPPSLKRALKEEVLEEENCSSPMKKVKPLDKKKKKDSPPKIKNEKVSPKKERSDKEETTEAVDETPEEKQKMGQEESTAALEKTQKKPKINPFAPKPSSSGSKDVGADYNPGKKKYHPIDDAFWNKSEKVPYLALAKTLELIENTSGRLRTIEMLANFYRSVIVLSPDDLLYCVYLCLNKVAPAFEGIELGIGETVVMRTIAQASGRSVEKIKSDVEKQGDLGIVAEQSRSSQRLMFQPAKLNVQTVFNKLKEIALMSGNSSQSKKIDKIKGMYVACRYSESRYLIRSLGGKLRIGLAEQSVLQALAQACYMTPPGQDYPPEVLNAGAGVAADRLKVKVDNAGLILKTTYCEFPNYDKIIPVLLEEGLEKLPERCRLTPGVPLKPMLAHPTTGVSEVLRRFENAKFTCEFKYDGERAQIHLKEDGTINIYSRNQEDNTTKYPDIISRFKNALGDNVKSCVVDSEAVAWDREKKQILPFQILSTRKRKDANEKEIKVQVCVFPFDLLYLNGEPQVRQTFEHRRALLKENFKEVEGEFVFAKSMDSTNTEDIEEFLEESIKGNCEGLMVKTLNVDATYEIAKRSRNWLKLKKDYLDGVGDTIDVVPIGGYMGKGKRAGQYGGFLLACYDPDNEEYQSLCKIGTGFTDESLSVHAEFFKDHTIEKPKSYYRFENGVVPDQWFEPVQVWEIKCADLSISPVHKAAAGIVDPEKGISLRFPRFLRIREDKTPEDATSSSQIAHLYNSQDQIKNKKSSKTEEEDFY